MEVGPKTERYLREVVRREAENEVRKRHYDEVNAMKTRHEEELASVGGYKKDHAKYQDMVEELQEIYGPGLSEFEFSVQKLTE